MAAYCFIKGVSLLLFIFKKREANKPKRNWFGSGYQKFLMGFQAAISGFRYSPSPAAGLRHALNPGRNTCIVFPWRQVFTLKQAETSCNPTPQSH
jgi:hypothetical protein